MPRVEAAHQREPFMAGGTGATRRRDINPNQENPSTDLHIGALTKHTYMSGRGHYHLQTLYTTYLC